MKKDNRQVKEYLVILLVAVLLAAGVFYYINDMKNSLWKQAVSEILEVTSQGSHAFEIYVEKDMQILKRIEKHLSQEYSGDEAAINEVIEVFADSGVSFAVIDLEHGMIYAGEGYGARKISADEVAAYEGYAEKGIGEPYLDESIGESVIGGYQRFLFADGAHGIVQVKRPISVVADEFMLSFYDNEGFSYIANEEGEIMLRPSHKNSINNFSNLVNVIENSGNSVEDVKNFVNSMTEAQEGAVRLVFDGVKSIFAYTPVRGTDGWYLVTIVPDAVIMRHADEILKSSQIFMLLMAGILVAAGGLLYVRGRSEKKLAEKEGDVQYREQLFSILANNTNNVFVMFTPEDHKVEYVSPNVERVLGIPEEEIRADIRTLERSMAEDGKQVDYTAVKGLEIGGSVAYEGERIHRKDGETRWFIETVYKAAVNNSERFFAVLSDRTDARRSEQALIEALETAKTANESKSVFLSNMSHDIRTPMNAIVGLSTLLQRDAHDPEKVQEYTRKIISSSQHLLGLINDVLDMSKIESGKATLNISEISLAEIVEELGTMMQPQAKAKGQEFKIDVYNICNEEVLGDRLRINQILINILSNAVKYTPEGGKVEMTVRQLPQNSKNYARFQFVVRDNGIGMSKEYLETIFQPFTREATKKTAGIQGTGLGMAITKNLVDLMGGTIRVESEPDKGSTFFIGLELRIKEQNVDPAFWEKHGVTNLLVVDDDEEICTGIRTAMTGTGVNLEYALDGQTAVKMAEEAQNEGRGFDLVLIDWQMPHFSGIETARRIRKIVPSHVPIMILTAYDISQIEEEGKEAGIDGFLQKPFFMSNFKMMLGRLKEQNESEKKAEEQDDVLVGKHVLAAEDIELNAEILMELLKMAGADCDWACNGKEALEKFRQSAPGRYDVILMDVQMPVMNGYEAAEAIRKCGHPQAETIPIIAMTANAFSEDVKEALDAGMNKHVAKPIELDRLKAAMKEVLV